MPRATDVRVDRHFGDAYGVGIVNYGQNRPSRPLPGGLPAGFLVGTLSPLIKVHH